MLGFSGSKLTSFGKSPHFGEINGKNSIVRIQRNFCAETTKILYQNEDAHPRVRLNKRKDTRRPPQIVRVVNRSTIAPQNLSYFPSAIKKIIMCRVIFTHIGVRAGWGMETKTTVVPAGDGGCGDHRRAYDFTMGF